MNNFVKRTLSGSIFVALTVGSILLSRYSFGLLFAVVSSLTILEFHLLTNKQKEVDVNLFVALIGTLILFVSSFLFASGVFSAIVYCVYITYLILVVVAELYRQKENPINNLSYFALGQLLIASPFALLNFIFFIPDYESILLLAVFLCIWANDTGAYLVGVSFGKHRLFKRISPKKSWEGFFGGAVFALVFACILAHFFPILSLTKCIIFSELIVVLGTFGDLTESLFKRTLNVKDSSSLIPGHGGFLDRFDSMLLVAPVIFIFLQIILLRN